MGLFNVSPISIITGLMQNLLITFLMARARFLNGSLVPVLSADVFCAPPPPPPPHTPTPLAAQSDRLRHPLYTEPGSGALNKEHDSRSMPLPPPYSPSLSTGGLCSGLKNGTAPLKKGKKKIRGSFVSRLPRVPLIDGRLKRERFRTRSE